MGHISLMLIVFSAFSSILPEPKLSLCSSRHYLNQLHVLLITSGYKTCATGWMTLVTASQCIRKPFFEDTGKRNIAQVKKKIAFVTCLSVIPTWSYFHFLDAFSNISPEPKLNICSSRYCISLLLLVLKHTTVCNIHDSCGCFPMWLTDGEVGSHFHFTLCDVKDCNLDSSQNVENHFKLLQLHCTFLDFISLEPLDKVSTRRCLHTRKIFA